MRTSHLNAIFFHKHYRSIGTILEMTRAIAIKLVEQNLRVRVCVQGTMVRWQIKSWGYTIYGFVSLVPSLLTLYYFVALGSWYLHGSSQTIEWRQ